MSNSYSAKVCCFFGNSSCSLITKVATMVMQYLTSVWLGIDENSFKAIIFVAKHREIKFQDQNKGKVLTFNCCIKFELPLRNEEVTQCYSI